MAAEGKSDGGAVAQSGAAGTGKSAVADGRVDDWIAAPGNCCCGCEFGCDCGATPTMPVPSDPAWIEGSCVYQRQPDGISTG